MWSAIISAAVSLFKFFVDKSMASKVKMEEYVGYIKEWLKRTPTGAEVSDEHDEIMDRKVKYEEN